MRLADFILNDTETIIKEWEAFAAKQFPAASGMTSLALRDTQNKFWRPWRKICPRRRRKTLSLQNRKAMRPNFWDLRSDNYARLLESGRSVTRSEIECEVRRMFAGNLQQLVGMRSEGTGVEPLSSR